MCLNACVDTASFGDVEAWASPPAVPDIRDGKLFGRGAADSKAGVAIFAHLFDAFAKRMIKGRRGRLVALFDAGEHTGQFTGIRRFLETTSAPPDSFIIGYPGQDQVYIGARGFLRVTVEIKGQAAHSGGSAARGDNAIYRAAALVQQIERAILPTEPDAYFTFGPRVTVGRSRRRRFFAGSRCRDSWR